MNSVANGITLNFKNCKPIDITQLFYSDEDLIKNEVSTQQYKWNVI